MHEEICLESEYDYEFSMCDSFGDVLYCFEGLGSCEVSVDNVAIKNDGNFGTSEKFAFKFQTCATDDNYNDNDSATNDLRIQNAATCVCTIRNCDEYGTIFEFNIAADASPRETRWTVRDENGIIHFEGGPYQQTRNAYSDKKYLPSASYNFAILDSKSDGLYEEDGGGCFLSVGDKVIEEYRGDEIDGRHSSRSKSFIICMSDDQCQQYNFGACSQGTCICALDE